MVCADRLAVRAMGKFAEEWRAKSREEKAKAVVERASKKHVNEKWRRITGITVDIEHCMDGKERRAGIRDLVDWIEAWVREELRGTKDEVRRGETADVEMGLEGLAGDGALSGGGVSGESNGIGLRERRGGCVSLRDPDSGAIGATLSCADARDDHNDGNGNVGGLGAGGGEERGAAKRLADARSSEVQWACEGQAREVVVRVCGELNISRNKLTELVREVRGISATELIDGFRVRKVKSALAERVKKFARELWLSPGNYVGVLVADKRLMVCGGGKSEFFVDGTEDFYRQELAETKDERMDALMKAIDAGWRRGGNSRDGFAVSVGFRSFSEMNRACLNVWGKSARDVVWDVCSDVMDYYLAREEEELRELACCGRETPTVAKARYLYWGSTKRPEGATAKVSGLWERLGEEFREGMRAWMSTA